MTSDSPDQSEAHGRRVRQRTSAQLSRKRAIDRELQKVKRARAKVEAQQKANEIDTLRRQLDAIKTAARSWPIKQYDFIVSLLDGDLETSADGSTIVPGIARSDFTPTSPSQYSTADSRSLSVPRSLGPSNTSEPRNDQDVHLSLHLGPQQNTRAEVDEHKPINPWCRCGRDVHESALVCFEETMALSIVEAHARFGGDQARPVIPAIPSVADLCLIGQGENCVSRLVIPYFRQPMDDTATSDMFAMFIGVYVLLRYRMFPSLESYNEIPGFLKSTKAQEGWPHAFGIDLLPFPELRTVLSLQLHPINQVEFDEDLLKYLTCSWPDSKPLLLRRGPELILNEGFMDHIKTYENWQMKRGWAAKYPRLGLLVNNVGEPPVAYTPISSASTPVADFDVASTSNHDAARTV